MIDLLRAAQAVQQVCKKQKWGFCFIGGIAVQRWGDPRQTRAVDVTLLTGLGGEERFIDPILARCRPRFPEARGFALEHRVLLVEAAHGIPLDIALGGLPYEARVVERSTPFAVEPAVTFMTCSAEDLVVLKAFAGRAQDWIDVESVIVRQGSRLDRGLVVAELRPLVELKEDAEAEHALGRLFAKHPG